MLRIFFKYGYCTVFVLLMVFSISTTVIVPNQQQHQVLAQKTSSSNSTSQMSSASPSPSKATTTANFLTYDNPMYGVKIQYPSDWTASQNGLRDYSDIVAFYSPLDNLTSNIPEQLLLSRKHYSVNVTLDDYTKLVNSTLNQPAIQIVESKPVMVAGGNPGYRMVFTPSGAINGPFKPEIMLVWTVKDNNVYTLSFRGDAAKYSAFLPTIQKMIDSFEITPTNTTATANPAITTTPQIK